MIHDVIIWLESWPHILQTLTAISAFSSLAANWVSPASRLGTFLHWVGGNGKAIRDAIVAARATR